MEGLYLIQAGEAVYKISEFSKISGLTVKALRYYDEQDILKPSFRADNSYRYYDEEDFKRAGLIALLRNLDFSIPEIRDIVAHYDSPEDLAYYLSEKQEQIAVQIEREKELIEKIGLYLNPKETGVGSMDHKIEEKEFGPISVLAIRFKGRYSDVGEYFGTIYKEAKGKASGESFSCYYDDEYKEEADIEICVPTNGKVSGIRSVAKQVPGIKAICTTHIGSYDTLNYAYKALFDYAKEHNMECGLPSREIYHKGPGMIFKGNPNKYVTEIVIPVAKEG